ncbi:transmembrane 125 [Pelobates cultripes]|uniref:Transmembrane 125 n=1 Tax=Pelobates cultripes TaxID=61616 RepID=A0AAD1SVQ3_PELCU|nr:transmembrane 125 [Pelobates cultripes]
MEEPSTTTSRTPPNQEQMEDEILQEHMELWWSRDPVRSIVCYTTSVLLILACGIGGIVLLSTTTSRSGEWRLAIGSMLCILALLILLKQLLSSAIQDMHCIQSRERIDMLKSGGFSDILIFLFSGLIIFISGVVLYILSFTGDIGGYGTVLITMHSVGLALLIIGAIILLGLLVYVLVMLYWSCVSSRGPQIRNINIFSVSGQLSGSSNTTSSMANLI